MYFLFYLSNFQQVDFWKVKKSKNRLFIAPIDSARWTASIGEKMFFKYFQKKTKKLKYMFSIIIVFEKIEKSKKSKNVEKYEKCQKEVENQQKRENWDNVEW